MEPRRLRLTTFTLIALLVIAGTAIAGTTITADPLNQSVIIGEIGTYNITVRTDAVENHTISFNTLNDSLLANLTGPGVDTGALSKTGSGNWTPTAGVENYTFTYMVEPQMGIPFGDYDMVIDDSRASSSLYARAIVTIAPIPELATFALVGIGLIGLVALGRRKE